MKQAHLLRTTAVAVMTALATVIYMIFPEIPLVPGVEYLKVDLSDIPAVVTALTVGPVGGFLVELLKNIIHLTRTTTFGIGELINVGIGTVMVFGMSGLCRLFGHRSGRGFTPAVYYLASAGTIVATILAGWLLNAVLTPLYFRFCGIPLTTATLAAGVWGSTLLNVIKCSITVLPIYPLICIIKKSVGKRFDK